MFKRNVFKILGVVFFLLAGASFYNSNKDVVKTSNKIIVKTNNQTPNKNKIMPSIIKGSENPTPTNRLNPTILPTQIIIQPTNIPPTSVPPTSAPQGLKVSLSIAGSSVGSFEIPEGSNQCDLLTQALSQGKIQSLNMRYNNDYGTNAVYQINGIGKENAVWWGFKVNGQSPSQGCSYIKVNNGDSVLWEYVGN